MLPQLIQYLSNGFHVFSSLAFNIDENIIEVNNNKDIKVLRQDFVDVILKHGQGVCHAKKYYLILKVAITGPENHLLLVAFPE